MKALIQRVSQARVVVEGRTIGAINEPGLCVLVGVTHDDGPKQVETIARKIASLRIMRDEKSASDLSAPVLVISQFTLYGDARKGRRPTWNQAAPGPVAEPLVDALVEKLRLDHGLRVETGEFGADMAVSLTNDGPVTLMIEA